MEEDGTVVYFKTSPAVEGLKEEDDAQEFIFSDEQHFESQTKQKESSDKHSTWKSKGFQWKQIFSLDWLLHAGKESQKVERAVSMIQDSPLLTEEDFQLLQFTLTELPPELSNTCKSRSDSTSDSSWSVNGFWVMLPIAVAFMACGIVLHQLMVVACASVGLGGALLMKMFARRIENKIDGGVSVLSLYHSHMESLLSLLTQTVRNIQEVEIIFHGYARPSRNVPISRLERQSSGYQCWVLRKRVFETCQHGILLLREVTQQLCKKYPLNEELDNTCLFLAFVPLERLHQHILEDVDSEDTTGQLPCLSLESLKNACNLLAVQSSEMLRRLALNLAHNQPQDGNQRIKLNELPALLEQPLHFVSEACANLKWSLEFHKNCLFGDPPTTRKSGKSASEHHSLQPVADEVHCMDLKAQVALQRIRELGSVLANLPPLQKQDADIDPLKDLLLSIQHDIDGVGDHVTEGVQLLDNFCHHEGSQDLDQTSQEDTDNDSELDPESHDQLCYHGDKDAECSDDEMVFEAYVPPHEVEIERDSSVDQLTEREREELEKKTREAREVPLKMVKELRSVLAVRSVAKEKRRQERKRKKQLGDHLHTEVEASAEENGTTVSASTKERVSGPENKEEDASDDAVITTSHVQEQCYGDSTTLKDTEFRNHDELSIGKDDYRAQHAGGATLLQVVATAGESRTTAQLAAMGRHGLGNLAQAAAMAGAVLSGRRHVEVFEDFDDQPDTS